MNVRYLAAKILHANPFKATKKYHAAFNIKQTVCGKKINEYWHIVENNGTMPQYGTCKDCMKILENE